MLVCPKCKLGTEVAPGDPSRPLVDLGDQEEDEPDDSGLVPDSYGCMSSYLSEQETVLDDDERGKGTAKGKAKGSINGNGNGKGKAAAPTAPPASWAKRKACGFDGLEPPPTAKPKGGASGAAAPNVEPTQQAKAKAKDKGKAKATSESGAAAPNDDPRQPAKAEGKRQGKRTRAASEGNAEGRC